MQQAPAPSHNQRGRYQAVRVSVLVVAVIATGVAVLFREPLRQQLMQSAALGNRAPSVAMLEEMVSAASNPGKLIQRLWDEGGIVHRQVAIRAVSRMNPTGPLDPGLERVLVAGALDLDLGVRETALSALFARQHPLHTALAARQLSDVDPQVRLLGLQHLRRSPQETGMPLAMSMLDDADPRVVVSAIKMLERWSGEDFGVHLSDTVPQKDAETGITRLPEDSHRKARAGANRAREWWARQGTSLAAPKLELPADLVGSMPSLMAPDFELHDLKGGSVRLSDLRGKTVLINFWTTWCTACVQEIPSLIELAKRRHQDLVILGVSLDFVPDEHGHIGGHSAALHESHDDHDADSADALERVRRKVKRTVAQRGINYPILLDEHNDVGGMFNGGELPTTVIVDPDGRIRRRFIGTRELDVFEAMVAEATSHVP